jgi:copper amine oxidase-like protein
MKKFISFVMAGAMVASLVPATAFAKGDVTATAKVVDALEKAKDFHGEISGDDAPELQLKVTGVDYREFSTVVPELKVTVTLDKAEFTGISASDFKNNIKVIPDENTKMGTWNPTGGSTPDTKDFTASGDKATAAADVVDNADSKQYVLWKSESDYHTVKSLTYDKVGTVTESAADKRDDAFADYVSLHSATLYDVNDYTWNEGNARYELNAPDPTNKPNQPAFVGVGSLSGDADYPFEDTVVSAADAKASLEAAIQTDLTAGYELGTTKVVSGIDGDGTVTGGTVAIKKYEKLDDDQMEITFGGKFEKGDVISFKLASTMTKTSEGTKASVSVDSKAVTADDLVYASILGKGFKASVRKTVDVAEDERVVLNSSGLKIEAAVGNLPKEVTLKINSGFEFTDRNSGLNGKGYTISKGDDDKELIVTVADGYEDITIKDIEIEAVSAKSGAVATITAKASNNDSASCEVAKVVDYKVSLTVDADEDLPVIFSGTDAENAGITDDSDHLSLEVTAKESFPGAWSMRQGFNFNLPEGVYVTNVKNIDAENFFQNGRDLDKEGSKTDTSYSSDKAWQDAFFNAYQDGDHKNFEFKKRVFDDVNTNVTDNDPAEITFQLELVADPTFEGDVKLALEGPLVDKQEVTIAKFVKPYTVKAEQNDVIIDYRNTEVKTPIVITEAEEGLWKKDSTFKLNIEDDLLTFEDDPTFTIDSDSDLKLKDDKTTKGTIQYAVKEESDKAASVTISDMKLFMSRSIPAGAYDLEIATTMSEAYDKQLLFAPDAIKSYTSETAYENAMKDLAKEDGWKDGDRDSNKVKKDSYVDDVCDYSDVVKAAFINVVTSGRDNDNLFTTKVVVPVGEAYLLAGEAKVELDAPAYISAAGYTMLPVRAISKALGVNTNNVLWNAETRTVTIMYAQRIITMTVGQKTIYVNGSAIPASAAPEIKDERTFLPLRDLGTALGVTNVSWDAATKTATLN